MNELRQAATIAQSIWSAKRMGFLALLCMALVWSMLLRFTAPRLGADAQNALGYLPMALSLFLTFVFCTFTESDRRGRFEGFPSRLFTLPVRTRTLMGAPMLFAILVILFIYGLWAQLVLPWKVPLGWPLLYLASGMICYQATVWALAPFRTARLLVLGICGSLYATVWIAFSDGFAESLVLMLLGTLSVVAVPVAYLAIESARRGKSGEWQGWRKLVERLSDLLPRSFCFDSPGQAQFWYEWRRHGMLLPVSVAGVLFIIMGPTACLAPLTPAVAYFCLMWILLTPFLLAFPLGKGFGKADLWSKESEIPLFIATRPLSNREWVTAKLKVAAVASVVSWLVVAVMTPVWLWLCCDRAVMPQLHGLIGSQGKLVLLFGVVVILTWRLLAGSLYIGLSGKKWMLTAAACGVFVTFIGSIFLVAALSERPLNFAFPKWSSWVFGGLFAIKVAVSLYLNRSLSSYFFVWLASTGYLLFAVWKLFPPAELHHFLLALLVVPLLRITYAPIALAGNRSRPAAI